MRVRLCDDARCVPLWLTFALPSGGGAPSRAVLSSVVMSVAGSPFEDLGTLLAEPVTYGTFGPQLFDLAPDGDGNQDLALFFLTDSNVNESGIFHLDLS